MTEAVVRIKAADGISPALKGLCSKLPVTLNSTACGINAIRQYAVAKANMMEAAVINAMRGLYCNGLSLKAISVARHIPLEQNVPTATETSSNQTRSVVDKSAENAPKNHLMPSAESKERTFQPVSVAFTIHENSTNAANKSIDVSMSFAAMRVKMFVFCILDGFSLCHSYKCSYNSCLHIEAG